MPSFGKSKSPTPRSRAELVRHILKRYFYIYFIYTTGIKPKLHEVRFTITVKDHS